MGYTILSNFQISVEILKSNDKKKLEIDYPVFKTEGDSIDDKRYLYDYSLLT